MFLLRQIVYKFQRTGFHKTSQTTGKMFFEKKEINWLSICYLTTCFKSLTWKFKVVPFLRLYLNLIFNSSIFGSTILEMHFYSPPMREKKNWISRNKNSTHNLCERHFLQIVLVIMGTFSNFYDTVKHELENLTNFTIFNFFPKSLNIG